VFGLHCQIVNDASPRPVDFVEVERFAFYERAKKAFAVVATGCVQESS
jgi:L-fucose mutarotase/ribose pyranase (RbsD/FucU family)